MNELEQHHWGFSATLPDWPTAARLHQTLNALVAAVEMTPLPKARQVYVRSADWNAIQVIAESHIVLHGHGVAGCADVFSCRPFSPVVVEEVLALYMGGRWTGTRLRRGWDGAL